MNRSIKFAPVAPARIYKEFVAHGYIPSTVLLLAHDVVNHKQDYEDVFCDPIWAGTNIIMDNSVVELGGSVDLRMIAEACAITGANIAVLPDVMGESYASLMATTNASWQWRDHLPSHIQLMALIQGEDIQRWLWCGENLAILPFPINWIGIPRIAEGIKDIRTEAVYHRSDLVKFTSRWLFPGKPIHLFGFSNSIWEDLRAAALPEVMSIDSAVPLRLSTCRPLSEDAGKRGDWWETCVFNQPMIDNCKEINMRIGQMEL